MTENSTSPSVSGISLSPSERSPVNGQFLSTDSGTPQTTPVESDTSPVSNVHESSSSNGDDAKKGGKLDSLATSQSDVDPCPLAISSGVNGCTTSGYAVVPESASFSNGHCNSDAYSMGLLASDEKRTDILNGLNGEAVSLSAVLQNLNLSDSQSMTQQAVPTLSPNSYWGTSGVNLTDDTYFGQMNGNVYQNVPQAQYTQNMAQTQYQNNTVSGQSTSSYSFNMPPTTLSPMAIQQAIANQKRAITGQRMQFPYQNPKTYSSWSSPTGSQQATWTNSSSQNQGTSAWVGSQHRRPPQHRYAKSNGPFGNVDPSLIMSSQTQKYRYGSAGMGQGMMQTGQRLGYDSGVYMQQQMASTQHVPYSLEGHLMDIIRSNTPTGGNDPQADLMKGFDEVGGAFSDVVPDPNLQMGNVGMVGGVGMGGVNMLGQSANEQFMSGQGMRSNFLGGAAQPHALNGQYSPRSSGVNKDEKYSRKVFVGGLPPDIDEGTVQEGFGTEEEITVAFKHFGPVMVDWPHKAESKSYFPPKGYCFLLFQEEISVQNLIDSCISDESKLYWCVSSPSMKDKPVQIRPWKLDDADYVLDGSHPLDPRKTIFVGGVPRPLRAFELAMIMNRLYGGVCYAGIDTDPELKYPKGAGRVAFSNQQSYIAAINARFVQLQHGDIDKRVCKDEKVEVKPYVLDDQMCDECSGTRCAGKFAPFFCANITCLQYYCEGCWQQIHALPGREFHKPLVKEGADRPRAVPFRRM